MRLSNALLCGILCGNKLGSSAAWPCGVTLRSPSHSFGSGLLRCPAYLSGVGIERLTLGPPHPNQSPLEDHSAPVGWMAQVALGLSVQLGRFHGHCWLGKEAAQVGGKAKANEVVQRTPWVALDLGNLAVVHVFSFVSYKGRLVYADRIRTHMCLLQE